MLRRKSICLMALIAFSVAFASFAYAAEPTITIDAFVTYDMEFELEDHFGVWDPIVFKATYTVTADDPDKIYKAKLRKSIKY